MTGIVIPDGGTIGSTSDTDAISVASNGEVTVNESIKATAIKHTNGTTAITINSDGSLSGKFEGAVKFVSTNKATGNPTDTNKVRIAFGITSSYYHSTATGKYMGHGFGEPCAVQSHDGSSWGWVYQTPRTGEANAAGSLGSSTTATGHSYAQQMYTYTIEMDKV